MERRYSPLATRIHRSPYPHALRCALDGADEGIGSRNSHTRNSGIFCARSLITQNMIIRLAEYMKLKRPEVFKLPALE